MRHPFVAHEETDRLATVEEVQLACDSSSPDTRCDAACTQAERRGWISTEELLTLSETELAYLFSGSPAAGSYTN